MIRGIWVLALAASAELARADDSLWQATPLTRAGEFTKGIVGPAADAAGNIFAVNFARQGANG